MVILLLTITVSAQEHLQKQASDKVVKKSFTTLKENPITSVKNQYCTSFLTPCVVFKIAILNPTKQSAQENSSLDARELFSCLKSSMDTVTTVTTKLQNYM
jgi:hypothetical protein